MKHSSSGFLHMQGRSMTDVKHIFLVGFYFGQRKRIGRKCIPLLVFFKSLQAIQPDWVRSGNMVSPVVLTGTSLGGHLWDGPPNGESSFSSWSLTAQMKLQSFYEPSKALSLRFSIWTGCSYWLQKSCFCFWILLNYLTLKNFIISMKYWSN